MPAKLVTMVSDATKGVGIDLNLFGEYIHEIKAQLGMRASVNFTYKQLVELAKELKKV